MANHHPSPTMMQMQQQQPLPHHAQVPPPAGAPQGHMPPSVQISALNEAVWMQLGSFAELLRMPEEAMHAYERGLTANPNSISAMNAIGMLLKGREAFEKALEFFRAIVQLDPNNGEAWGNLGHCYLMTEDLQKAYDAYQAALVKLRDPKDPMLWYGIGILYDRYGSYDYAEEAFSQVMAIQPDFEKANEIYFRLGIIYKQQQKYTQSLDCFKYIVNSPPGPLTQEDIWFQIGHVHEQQKDFEAAKSAYLRVLDHAPMHAKVLQQLGWLYHQQNNSYETQDRAISYLEKSVAADGSDAQSWYLLGRCYMAQQKYSKAYEAYQQAVYRDGKSPTFWCSIGVLYYQINQYRDALDAYSRAIRLNPYISEVWYDLGTLYESCNNQTVDALDAYQRAADLDPTNPHIKARLQLLQSGGGANGAQNASLPQPTDMHFQSIQAAGPTPQWGGGAQHPAAEGPRPHGQGAGERMPIASLNPAPQPPNSFDSRGEQFRGQVPPLARQPSPHQDQQMRPFPEPNRGSAPRRPPTPPGSSAYPGHLPAAQSQGPQGGERRMGNSSWGASGPGPAGRPPGPTNGAPPNGMAPYRPTNSPRPEGRSQADNRMPSPKSAYPQHQPQPIYPHHQDAPPHSGPENGPPPPAAAEGPAQRVEEPPSSVGPKRMREWEEEAAVKKQANDENRARLEDTRHRRPSTPPREAFRRNSGEARRSEEQHRAEEPRRPEESRHANDSYHPSEAAHHPHNHSGVPTQLPPMQATQNATPNAVQEKPPVAPEPKDDRPSAETSSTPRPAAPASEPERAARKMDVDEDYDDSGEDDKKAGVLANGSGPGSASGDAKISTPTSAGANGATATTTKQE